jgi:NTE family protein
MTAFVARRLRALCTLSFALLLVAGATAAAAEARPRVGLVLGGGGALGAAHVGVLKVLEELRVPVDCIAGTSMGALVGGAYASGMSAAEAEQFLTDIDWQSIFSKQQKRRYQPMRVKRDNLTVSNKLEFGLGEHGLIAPRGLVETQQVESLLRNMVASQTGVENFDRLPIPFRAVATDLKSGQMVVFRSGDLPTALRASMSVPGAFAPVEVGDWLLVDGGITRNLPVDVAREACADVVIAIAVSPTEPEVERMRSAAGSLGRMVEIMIRGNEQASLNSLAADDVGVSIVLEDVTSVDFHMAASAIEQGERAARAASGRLRTLALPESDYQAWADARNLRRGAPAERRVAGVRFEGVDAVSSAWLATRITTRAGSPLDDAVLADDALRIFATGAYESVSHRYEGPPAAPVVVFLPVAKSWGPTFIAFDYGIESSLRGDPLMMASALLRHTWPQSAGREWRGLVQIGRETRLETDLRNYFGTARRFFALPRIGWYDEREDYFVGDDRVATYDSRSVYGQLRAGVEMDTWGELQLGLYRSVDQFAPDIGSPLLPSLRDYDDGGLLVEFERDTRDSDVWATSGSRQRLEYLRAESALGAADAYETLLVEWNESIPLGRALLLLDLAGGSALGSTPPPQQYFRLGGPGALSGLEYGALRGEDFLYTQAGLGWRLTDVDPLLGMTLFAGAAIEAGNVWNRVDGTSASGLLLGGRLFFGGSTPFGPVTLSLGYVDSGDLALFLGLGRPVVSRWR